MSFFEHFVSRLIGRTLLFSGTITTRDPLLLSKSKYLIGLQCPKALWIHYNDNRLIPALDAGTAALFDHGHEIGLLAHRLFTGGIRIGHEDDLNEAIRATRVARSLNVPLFEPAFCHGRCFCRADILDPAGDGRWDIIEVKSSTEVRPVYLSRSGISTIRL